MTAVWQNARIGNRLCSCEGLEFIKRQTHILYRDIFMLLRRLTLRLHHCYVGRRIPVTNNLCHSGLVAGCFGGFGLVSPRLPLEITHDVSTVGGSTKPLVSKVPS